jgi:hypothetical protein
VVKQPKLEKLTSSANSRTAAANGRMVDSEFLSLAHPQPIEAMTDRL